MQRYVSKELIHFLGRTLGPEGRYSLMLEILRSGWLTPPPHKKSEKITSLSIRYDRPVCQNSMYAPEMVCFADIPIQEIRIHQKKYGGFGISFRKSFLLNKGVRPVFYIPTNALWSGQVAQGQYMDEIAKNWGKFFCGVRPQLKKKNSPWLKSLQETDQFLAWEVFSYTKCFDGGLEDDHPDNFYMEPEWRKLGGIQFDLSDACRVILPSKYAARFRSELPAYSGQLTFSDD